MNILKVVIVVFFLIIVDSTIGESIREALNKRKNHNE
tara:strand:- start:461 stop:571 length:111 start_codon:yes stop_codon:yes gene_type:complete